MRGSHINLVLTISRLRDFYANQLKMVAGTQDGTRKIGVGLQLKLKPGAIPSQHWDTEEPDEIDSTDLKGMT